LRFQKIENPKNFLLRFFRSTKKGKRDDCALMSPIPNVTFNWAVPFFRALFTADHFFR
jgi:hypothetical protein